jgi:hypothetical protein
VSDAPQGDGGDTAAACKQARAVLQLRVCASHTSNQAESMTCCASV